MFSGSEEENYQTLDTMVNRSTHYLLQIFKQRWKIESGEEWRDEPNYIQSFLTQHCQNMLHKAIPFQRKMLMSSCSLEDWDISLISLVLLNFGDRNKYKLQNQAIRQLKNLRNDLAHHKSKKITQSEYSEKFEIFKGILEIIEIKQSEIEKIVQESITSLSLGDTERLKMLLKSADELLKTPDFESALTLYSEAVSLPRIAPENLGDIYEKRASCYLKTCIQQCKSAEDKYSDQAALDVEQALKLNKSSWNAHYLKAQCYKIKNNLPEAIRSYEMALAMSPVQRKVKQDLESCKLQHSSQKANANLNLDQLPMSAKEIVKEIDEEYGNVSTLERFAQLNGFHKHPVFIGDKYFYGFEVIQSYSKAMKYYAQADKQGFAEGTYKLGLCYYKGNGVEQDVRKSIEIFKRCAKMDAKKRQEFATYSPLGFNIGVSFSERALGNCYKNGTEVEKHFGKAAIWYTKAMKHGDGDAATDLGLLYYHGNGLKRDEKMAGMCWKQGLNLNCVRSAAFLVDYYCSQLEPEMAWVMFKIGREMGHSKLLEISDTDFDQSLTMVQSERCRLEEYVTTFEKENNLLDFKGLTFRERLARTEQQLNPNAAQMINNKTKSCGGEIQSIAKDVMKLVALKGFYGSETAFKIFKTINSIYELNDLVAAEKELCKEDKLKAVNLFYDVMISEDHLKGFVKNETMLQAILAELFNETCQQAGEQEMKVRLCYAGYNLWASLNTPQDIYAFEVLKEGHRRYPDNYGYYRFLIYGSMGRKCYENGLKYIDEALEKFPEKADLHFFKGVFLLSFTEVEPFKKISAFKVFLDNAERDHRLVPEAHYAIGFVYMEDYIKHGLVNDPVYFNNEKLKIIQDNFKCGQCAEYDQLPCYLPYGPSGFKSIIEGFLVKMAEKYKLDFKLTEDSKIGSLKQPESVLERKEYLKSPVKKGLILQHRESLSEAVRVSPNELPFDDEVIPGKLEQKRAKKMSNLKAITLQEMNSTIDRIYENRILDLSIIEEPIICSNSIQVIAEDENGDSARIYMDVVADKNCTFVQQLIAGCRIAVINPYMGICSEILGNGIRINEPKCIMQLEKVKDFCRFCGDESATRKCSKCKRLYCSRECQKLDWQLFEHKLICSIAWENEAADQFWKYGFIKVECSKIL